MSDKELCEGMQEAVLELQTKFLMTFASNVGVEKSRSNDL